MSVLRMILPQPLQLAALGTVLCLYRSQDLPALAGWTRATRAEWSAGIDSDGLRESLWFYDGDNALCWRLYLLPDSDFMAWDQLSLALPTRVEQDAGSGFCNRLWRRMADQVRGDIWYACVLQLHALHGMAGVGTAAQPVLAASLVRPSTVGVAVARRIASAAGVNATSFVAGGQPIHAAATETTVALHAAAPISNHATLEN